jgi:hypothetical protein
MSDSLEFVGVTKPMEYGDPAFPVLIEARLFRTDEDGQRFIIARQQYVRTTKPLEATDAP